MSYARMRQVQQLAGRINVSLDEAAELLGVSKTLLRAMMTSGRMGPEPVRLSRRLLFRVADLERWSALGHPNREKFRELTQGSLVQHQSA